MSTKIKHKKTKTICPVAIASGLVGDMWVILIIRDLLSGQKRFGELNNSLVSFHTSMSINSRTLTNKLKSLENMGIIKRIAFSHEKPPRVEYALTSQGKALSKVINTIGEYGKKYLVK